MKRPLLLVLTAWFLLMGLVQNPSAARLRCKCSGEVVAVTAACCPEKEATLGAPSCCELLPATGHEPPPSTAAPLAPPLVVLPTLPVPAPAPVMVAAAVAQSAVSALPWRGPPLTLASPRAPPPPPPSPR